MIRGKLIVIEGLDGCGKTTAVERLKEDFPGAVFTKEPGGSPFGMKMRQLLLDDDAKNESALTQFCGHWAGRSSHVSKIIIPALDAGIHVFSDRFDASTFTFQLYGQENRKLESLFFETRKQVIPLIYNPRYIFLDLPVECALKRVEERDDSNHFDRREPTFHYRVHRGYRDFFSRHSIKPYVKTVDATRSRDEVYADVLARVKEFL